VSEPYKKAPSIGWRWQFALFCTFALTVYPSCLCRFLPARDWGVLCFYIVCGIFVVVYLLALISPSLNYTNPRYPRCSNRWTHAFAAAVFISPPGVAMPPSSAHSRLSSAWQRSCLFSLSARGARRNVLKVTRLIVFSGLPGSGKSSIARQLAKEIGAIWLRIDAIEEAIRESRTIPGSLDGSGYRAAYAIAADNLLLGRDVIGDAVNDWTVARNAWRGVGLRAGAEVFEVEIICSDLDEHRYRVENRTSDVPGLVLPDWQAVIERDYHTWDRDHLIIDTAGRTVSTCVGIILDAMRRDS
jgi:predicted kinase